MAATSNALLCASLAVVLWSLIGLPLAARVAPRAIAWALAPALGWAAHSAVMLPLLSLTGMSRATVAVLAAVAVIAAVAALWSGWDERPEPPSRLAMGALIAAALLAVAMMSAVLPKFSDAGVALAPQIFDHSKIAMVDEMARNGVPAGNPFYGEPSLPHRLIYYYLWHFSAAEIAVLAGASGWEADAGLSAFTAFAALALMSGLAVWLSGRQSAAPWTVVLAATGSLRPILMMLFGGERAAGWIGWQTGFGSWQFQSTWAPQHLGGAIAAVLAVFLLARLVQRPRALTLVLFSLTLAASFESSAWIGAIVLPLAASAIVVALLAPMKNQQRLRALLWLAAGGVLALAVAAPMIYDQYVSTMLRQGGSPIALTPFEALGDTLPLGIRRVLDLPAFWLLFLAIEWPATYIAGAATAIVLLRERGPTDERAPVLRAFALLTVVGLCVSWLLASIYFSNNDLGWRAALAPAMLMVVFAAAGLARVARRPLSLVAAGALALVVLAIPDGLNQIYRDIVVAPGPSSKLFAATPAMWQAVRRHTGPRDRIANNPLFLDDMVPWTINISWALLSDRRSCYPGAGFAGPFTALTERRRDAVDAQFLRIFAGKGSAEDLAQLGPVYECRLVVLTAQDGAWAQDPFASHAAFRLVAQEPGAWRLYEIVKSTDQLKARALP